MTTPAGSRAAPMRGARLALGLLIVINLFNYLDRNILAAALKPIGDTYLGEHGDSAVRAFTAAVERRIPNYDPRKALEGLLGTAFMVLYMIGAPVFARLARNWSRWSVVGLGVILWSLASGASGLAMTFVALLVTRCFVGIGEAAYGPIAPTIISDMFPLESRGKMLAWFYMAIPVGSALGYIFGEHVSGMNIDGWATEGWRWAFYLVVPPGILLGLWSFLMRDPPASVPLGTSARPPAEPVGIGGYLAFFRIRSFLFCTMGMTAMTFAMGGIAFWMPTFLLSLPDHPKEPTAIFGPVIIVAGLAGTILGGMAGDRLRGRHGGAYFLVSGAAMLTGFPIFLVVLKIAGLAHPFPWIWIPLFGACFCLFFNTGPTNAILANVTSPSARAAAFALNILIIHSLGDVISPVVIGILAGRFDMRGAFVIVGVMFLVAGIFWLMGARHLARDTAAAEQAGGQ